MQVRNCGFNMMESISKAGSAIAPQIVDLGGQVDNVHIETNDGRLYLFVYLSFFFASDKTPN